MSFRNSIYTVGSEIAASASSVPWEAAAEQSGGEGGIRRSRGYLTTPQELVEIARKARLGIEPYKTNVDDLMGFVKEPYYWPYGDIEGEVNVIGNSASLPSQLSHEASALVYAKALAYHITGNRAYADSARARILDLTDTFGYNGEVYSDRNQAILNLSRGVPPYVYAADLLEPYWKPEEKLEFQRWLRDEVYKKAAWNSRTRKNNWGNAGSLAASLIADYLWDTGWLLVEVSPQPRSLSLSQAFKEHNKLQIIRFSTRPEDRMDAKCESAWGIRSNGAIPEELRRGSSGGMAEFVNEDDSSLSYTKSAIDHITAHAEFLLRRGDSMLYDNIFPDGSGSLLKAVHFVIDNPVRSWNFNDARIGALYMMYRYYKAPKIYGQLQAYPREAIHGGRLAQFGRLTHGFAEGETMPPPPLSVPPQDEHAARGDN